MKTIDARGLSCPQPVILVQKAVKAESPAELTVVADDRCAVENVTRFGESRGYTVTWTEKDDEYTITLKK